MDAHSADLQQILRFLKDLKGSGLSRVELKLGDVEIKASLEPGAERFALPVELMDPHEEKPDRPKGPYDKAFEVFGVKDAS